MYQLANNLLQQEQAPVPGTKQGRQADKAGRPTRQAGRSIDVPALTANIIAAATRQNKADWPGPYDFPRLTPY